MDSCSDATTTRDAWLATRTTKLHVAYLCLQLLHLLFMLPLGGPRFIIGRSQLLSQRRELFLHGLANEDTHATSKVLASLQ